MGGKKFIQGKEVKKDILESVDTTIEDFVNMGESVSFTTRSWFVASI